MGELTTRECGACTACCDGWLSSRVDGCQLKPGSPCKHIGKSGCSIYPVRPQEPCVNFICGWLIDFDMPEWMNPKTSKVIIKPNFVWQKPSHTVPVHVATAAGPKIPGKTISWLRQYALEGGGNFVCFEPLRKAKHYTGETRKFGIGSPAFETDVSNWVAAGYDVNVTAGHSSLIVGDKFLVHNAGKPS